MNALGRHLLLELKDCNKEVLDDVAYLKDCLHDTAEQIGASVVNECFYQFSPHGISGVVIISESHLCIHTWPEHHYAAPLETAVSATESEDGLVSRIYDKAVLTSSSLAAGVGTASANLTISAWRNRGRSLRSPSFFR